MRQTWIGTNWKMNKTRGEAEAFARALREFMLHEETPVRVFVVPPFTALATVGDILRGTSVLVGAQNMHWEPRGAFTGEISPLMVRDCGAQIVELGHSERRAEFGETDFTVNNKVLAALKHGLRPLVCVGEPAVEKESGTASEFVARQVKLALRGVPRERIGEVIIAYEPVWAIGDRGTPAEPEYADAVQGLIRQTIAQLYGTEAAEESAILYGGSVNLDNAATLLRQPNIDGLFIGRAAWDVDCFIQLIRIGEARTR